jgi:hypothetical protein
MKKGKIVSGSSFPTSLGLLALGEVGVRLWRKSRIKVGKPEMKSKRIK